MLPEKFLWLRSPNGRLAAMLHPAKSDRLVIMSHGFSGTKCESGRLFLQTARAFAAGGLNALRHDFFGSGDSDGEFSDMSPNTEIADLLAVIKWARPRYRSIGLLGLSFGSAVSICAAARTKGINALVTWSTLPSFVGWRTEPPPGKKTGDPDVPGKRFYTDRPKVDVREAYLTLQMPKLQVQGDQDYAGFCERFAEYVKAAPGIKKHVILQGGDHVFTMGRQRRAAIAHSVRWMQKYL